MSATLQIIIVNFNTGGHIRDGLTSVSGQLEPGWTVTVVDNASTDRSVVGLEKEFPSIEVIHSPRNLGFAAANNIVLRTSKADYVLLLNPDAILGRGALRSAIDFMEDHTDVGVLGARVLLPDGSLDLAAHRSFKNPSTYFYKMLGLSRLFPRSRRFGRYYLSYLDEHKVAEVDAVVGAFMLLRQLTIADVGLLDERFFMYCEDEDWCWRAHQAGWRAVYNPEAVIRHAKGTSTRQARVRMVYHWHRSLWLYHRKNIARRHRRLTNAAVYAGIAVGLMGSAILALARQLAAALPELKNARHGET